MLSHYRTFIFDLDGTLLDSLKDLAAAVNHILSLHQMPSRTIDEVRSFLGNGYKVLLTLAAPEGTPDYMLQQLLYDFQQYYERHCTDYTQPYEGVEDVLRKLQERNIKMAIVSNKGQEAVSELNAHFFSRYIDTAIGETADIRRKPSPDTIYEALRLLGETSDHACYVGDSEVDLEAARNAGLPCISCSWGFRTKQYLVEKGATTIIDSPELLLTFAGVGSNNRKQ